MVKLKIATFLSTVYSAISSVNFHLQKYYNNLPIKFKGNKFFLIPPLHKKLLRQILKNGNYSKYSKQLSQE